MLPRNRSSSDAPRPAGAALLATPARGWPGSASSLASELCCYFKSRPSSAFGGGRFFQNLLDYAAVVRDCLQKDEELGWSAVNSFGSRVYSVNDFREWEVSDQLVLSPRFQRRSVWTDTARSYLMDTIMRGKPIPKIFLRQRIDPSTGRSTREVVDGQQRLRTILAYLQDGLVIRRSHNPELGGKYFSQLDEEVRLRLLNYELSTDLLINVSDEEVLDIFGRLNSHAVVLNQQEKINASHFGEFKQLADNLAHRHFKYWVSNKIITDAQVMRMEDVSFTADLLIAMCDGIQSKKQIGAYYDLYEEDLPYSSEDLVEKFHATISAMVSLFPDGFSQSEFHRVHLHYSLFTAVYHLKYGLSHMDAPRVPFDEINPKVLRFRLDYVEQVFGAEDHNALPPVDRQFLEDSRRATTDAKVRERRTAYLVHLAVRE